MIARKSMQPKVSAEWLDNYNSVPSILKTIVVIVISLIIITAASFPVLRWDTWESTKVDNEPSQTVLFTP